MGGLNSQGDIERINKGVAVKRKKTPNSMSHVPWKKYRPTGWHGIKKKKTFFFQNMHADKVILMQYTFSLKYVVELWNVFVKVINSIKFG